MAPEAIEALITTAGQLGYSLKVLDLYDDSVNISIIRDGKKVADLAEFAETLNKNSVGKKFVKYSEYYGEHTYEFTQDVSVILAGAYGIHEEEEDYLLSYTLNKEE